MVRKDLLGFLCAEEGIGWWGLVLRTCAAMLREGFACFFLYGVDVYYANLLYKKISILLFLGNTVFYNVEGNVRICKGIVN